MKLEPSSCCTTVPPFFSRARRLQLLLELANHLLNRRVLAQRGGERDCDALSGVVRGDESGGVRRAALDLFLHRRAGGSSALIVEAGKRRVLHLRRQGGGRVRGWRRRDLVRLPPPSLHSAVAWGQLGLQRHTCKRSCGCAFAHRLLPILAPAVAVVEVLVRCECHDAVLGDGGRHAPRQGLRRRRAAAGV